MRNVRVIFKKFGRTVYISHLDMNRFMTRAVRLAKIPIWYTEGFNSHPYITFAQPLSLGFESECEMLDMKILNDFSNDDIKNSLIKFMPEGIEIINVINNERSPKEIAFASYRVSVDFENDLSIQKILKDFFELNDITVEKKSKKGARSFDIKPHISDLDIKFGENTVIMSLILPSSVNISVNPVLILQGIEKYTRLKIDDYLIVKTGLLDSDRKSFL